MTARIQHRIYAGMAILVMLMMSVTWAQQTKTFTWVAPVERIDGTLMPGSDLVSYELGCAPTADEPPAVYSAWPVDDPLVVTRIETFPPGQWYCVLRVYAVAENGELSSDWSNQVFFSILLSAPQGPTGLSVN